MHHQACIQIGLIGCLQPVILTIYLEQGLINKNIFLTARLFTTLNLSARLEYFWTHFQIDTWLLFMIDDRHLAASRKLLELK
jgi:hypothetical protein